MNNVILTKLALSTIHDTLDGLGYSNYLYLAPQSASYPFVTFFPIANEIEYTFGENLEDVSIQLSIFVAELDVADMLDMASQIEQAFDELEAVDGDNVLYCTHRTNELGPRYLAREHYWQYDMELVFKLQRPKSN